MGEFVPLLPEFIDSLELCLRKEPYVALKNDFSVDRYVEEWL